MSERIQKLLATVGVASRREIERLIDEGRILVNGRPAEAGQRIDHNDSVRVDGRPISLKRKSEAARVLIYKKRTGELVTRDDPEGRRTVFRKLPKLEGGRWIAVGRLDINTSGLLLFTNHGELARRLTHPSFEVPRTYAVRVLGTVDDEVIARWKAGVELDDGKAHFERVERIDSEGDESANQWFHVSVREGRNRLVRRLIESQNLQVSRLIRISYGPIELGRGNKSGTAREATPAELLALLDAVGLSEAEAGLEPRRGARGGKPGAKPGAASKPVRRSFRDYDDDEDDDDDFDGRPQRSRRGPPDARPPAPGRRASPQARSAGRGRPQREVSRDERDERAPRDGARSSRDERRPTHSSSRPARDGQRPGRDARPASSETPRGVRDDRRNTGERGGAARHADRPGRPERRDGERGGAERRAGGARDGQRPASRSERSERHGIERRDSAERRGGKPAGGKPGARAMRPQGADTRGRSSSSGKPRPPRTRR